MVDLQSKYRLYAYGYSALSPRQTVSTYRELYHDVNRRLFQSCNERRAHDCRAEVMKHHTEPKIWDAWLLSQGLKETYNSVKGLNERPEGTPRPTNRNPDKLLYKVGIRGSELGNFQYPRGLCITENFDICIADSQNHRIQVFNHCGIFKFAFGEFGSDPGEFNEPSSVAVLANGDLAVADRRNKRVQVFNEKGDYQYQFPTISEPYDIACDGRKVLAVSTTRRTVELFDECKGTTISIFPVPSSGFSKRRISGPTHIAIKKQQEIVVSDPEDMKVKIFNIRGQLLHSFTPQTHAEGLSIAPGGVTITALDNIILADTLNHTVSLYTLNGTLLECLLTPLDELGNVHAVALGRDGHLVVTEFSMNNVHCLKIFRFHKCHCHTDLTPTSRIQTPESQY